jgi:type I restriction enzyme S subunit
MSSVVPDGWTKERLGNHVKLESGNAFQSLEFSDKGTPIVRISNIRNDKIDLSNAVYYEGNNRLEKFLIADGDILLAMSGATTGKIGKYTYSFKSYLNQRVGRFKIIDETKSENEYIYQLVRSREFAENTLIDAIGGAQPNISSSQIENVVYKFPPLPEQKKIASILTSVDEVIENTQKKIDKLQDLKKATMNELLTKGIGHTEFKDSELGRIPKSWEVKTIRELIEKVVDNRGKTPPLSKRGRELIEIASISKDNRFLNYKLSKKRVSEDTYHTWFRNGHPKVGDVLVPTVGLMGHCSIVREERGCIAQNLIGLRSSERLFGEYLYWVMYSHYVLEEIQRVLMGAVQPSLKVPHLLDASIPLPPFSEQQKITKILHSIEDNIIEVKERVAKTKDVKKSLMQDLLTGKVRVTVN